MSLDALIRRAQEGEHQAFGELVRQHQAMVRQQLRRLTHGDSALADDLAQDTFVTAWQNMPGFRGDAKFSTWLHRIAHQKFLSHCRMQGAHRRGGGQNLPPSELPGELTDLHDHGNQSVQTQWRIDIQAALAQLSAAQQHSVLYAWVLGMGQQEVATVMDLPLGTVKSHIARAKAHLQNRLQAFEPLET